MAGYESPICKLGEVISMLKGAQPIISAKNKELGAEVEEQVNHLVLFMLDKIKASTDSRPLQQASSMLFNFLGSLDESQRDSTQIIPKLAAMFYKLDPID